jgi:hypothetical protein
MISIDRRFNGYRFILVLSKSVVARYFYISFKVLRLFFKDSIEYLIRTFEVFFNAINNYL